MQPRSSCLYIPQNEVTEWNLTGASLLVFVWQANGHSFVHMEHEKAVLLLKSFQNTVDLVIQRELAV